MQIKKDFENIKRTMPEIIQEDYLKELGVVHEVQVKTEVRDWLASEEVLNDTGIYEMLSYKVLTLKSDIGELDLEIEKRLEKKTIFEDKYVQHILESRKKELEKELARIRFQLEPMHKARGAKYMVSTWDDKKKRAQERLPEDIVFPHLEKVKEHGDEVKSLCPFHCERTASFTWYKKDNHFHCFGCGAHGLGIIKFYMLLKKVDFKTAVEDLC